MQKPETIKKVLVAGRLTKSIAFIRAMVKSPDGTMVPAEGVNPDDMPKEVPTSMKGVVDILINERGCQVDIAQTYEEAKERLKNGGYDGVVIDAFLPTQDRAVGQQAQYLGISDVDSIEVGMQIAGIYLADEICTTIWGVVLDTGAVRAESNLLSFIPNGIAQVQVNKKLGEAVEEYGYEWSQWNHNNSNWKWIHNCDSCTVAALFGEI